MCLSRAFLVALVLATFGTVPSVAQSTADRANLNRILLTLPHTLSLSAEAQCADADPHLQRLCQGLIAARRAEVMGDQQAAIRSRDLLERLVAERPTWSMAWYGLGVARVQVARVGLLARSGPLHPVGVSNEVGAANALIRALEVDSTLVEAAEALALISVPREGASRLVERHAMLQRVRPMLSPAGRYGAAQVALEMGDGRVAIAHLGALRGSGMAHLALARAFYQAGMPDSGRTALIAGASDSTPAAVAAYRREIAWVAEPDELATWDSLPAVRRPDFLKAFWAERDVRGGLADGARLVEHYRRVEFVWAEFRRRIPQVGLQRNAGVAMAIDYAADEMMIRFANEYMSGDDPEVVANILRLDGDHRTLGAVGAFREFRSTQAMLDDRGVIWLRHGKPDKVARTSDGLSLEVWRYERPEGALVLQFREENFDGQVGASVLVPSLITANPLQRDQLCHLEHSLCSNNADPRGALIVIDGTGTNSQVDRNPGFNRSRDDAKLNTTSRVARYRELGLQAIAEATTTDAHARRFGRILTPVVQMYGLVRLPDGAGRALVAFAVPGAELAYTTPPEAGGRAVYPLRLEVLMSRRNDGKRVDLDTLRRFATAAPLREGQYLTGLLEVRLEEGEYVASVVMSQDDRGALARMQALAVPPAAGRLRVSDLVLGREGSGAVWHSGRTAVPLNPLNSYSKGSEAEVYYQVAGLAEGVVYQTRLELFDADPSPEAKSRLAIAFGASAAESRSEVTRTLGLKSLAPGRYRLQLTVTQGKATTSAVAWITVGK